LQVEGETHTPEGKKRCYTVASVELTVK